MQTLTLFISSPGDVQDERTVAGRVIERLQGKYWSFIRLDDVFWEYKAVRATAHYQDELINPGQCDLVLGVVWSRLGSPLPDRFRNSAGAVMTGTEWELEEAFAAHERNKSNKGEAQATPDILIYRRATARIRDEDPEKEIAAAESEAQLNAYLKREYFFANGTIKRPILAYADLDAFEEKLFSHLEELILKRIPKLKAGYEPPPISGSPFKNLKYFDFADADRFFGRNRAIREVQKLLLDQVQNRHAAFVLIYGASGYGKSSLMRAGLAPTLTRPGALANSAWRRAIMLPQGLESGNLCEQLARALFTPATDEDHVLAQTHGHWPLPGLPELAATTEWDPASFARELAHPDQLALAVSGLVSILDELDRHLLLQLDQLEEAFTIESITDDDRESFFRALSAISRCGRVWILATMRSEFFPRIPTQPSLHQLIQRGGGYILQPASDQELREIIRYPAFAARLGFERLITPRKIGDTLTLAESLDDQILLDAKGSQDALPLLEFTLHQLYSAITSSGDMREADTLLWDSYVEIGGLQGSIATVADQTFRGLRDHEQNARDRIFGNLVQVDAGGSDSVTRMRTPLATLIRATPGAEGFINAFRRNNLLIADEDQASGETVITLAHESLLSHWPVLGEWVKDHRGILRGRQRLREHTAQWLESERLNLREKGKRPADYLLQGGRLAEADEVILCGTFSDISADELRLIAGSRRASTKRVRFFQAATTIFALLAIGAGLLGWIATQRKKEANQARDRALASELAAIRAKGTAEGLINSMLYNLRDKLRPIGRTELLDDVSKQAEDYFKNNPSDSTNSKRNEEIMWSNRGDVFKQSGELREAKDAFEKSLEIAESLSRSEPENLPAQRDLNLIYHRLGEIAEIEGDLKSAREWYGKDLAIAKDIARENPLNSQAQGDLSTSYTKLGTLSILEGNLGAAREAFTESVEIDKKNAEANPANAGLQRDLGESYTKLGSLALKQGDFEAAGDAMGKSLDIDKRLVESDPRDAELARDLSVSYDRMASLALAQGDLKSANQSYGNSFEIRKALCAADSRNTQYQRDLSISYEKLGDIAQALGDLTSARGYFVKTLDLRQPLADADPDNAQAQGDLSVAYYKLGTCTQADGDPQAARDMFEKDLAISKRLAEADPTNADAQRDLGASYDTLGTNAQASGDLESAREFLELSLSVSQHLALKDPTDARAQRDLSISYNKLGDVEQAANNFKAARDDYDKNLAIAKSLADAHPLDAEAQKDLFISHYKFSLLANAEHDPGANKSEREQCYRILGRMDQAKMPFDASLLQFYEALKVEFKSQ